MNCIVVFALGIAVGVVATLMLRPAEEKPAPVVEAPAERVAESLAAPHASEPPPEIVPRPIVAPGPASLASRESPSLDEALVAAGGDFESLLVDGDTLLGGRADQVLSGDAFHRFVTELSRSPSVRAAEQHHRLFEQYHQLPSVRSGAVAVQALACGARMCAASLVGYDAASVDQAWTELAGGPIPGTFGSDTGFVLAMRDGAMIGTKKIQGPNGYERRVLVTLDSKVISYTPGFARANIPRPSGGDNP